LDWIQPTEVTMLPTLVEQYKRWFDYEVDSHRKVLASLDTVPADRHSSELFQKAMTILGHIVAARRMWLYRLGFSAFRPESLFPAAITRNGLLAELEPMEHEWRAYLAQVSETELGRLFEYQSTEGKWFRSMITDVLTQLYGHSLYHRGQIATLVRMLNGHPAETDFVFWSRESIERPAAP
jgi:uncharacterized damage-inducible protein DinB